MPLANLFPFPRLFLEVRSQFSSINQCSKITRVSKMRLQQLNLQRGMRSTVLTVSLRTDEQSIIKLNEMILLYQVCSNTIVWCVLHKLTNQTTRVSGSMVLVIVTPTRRQPNMPFDLFLQKSLGQSIWDITQKVGNQTNSNFLK